MTITTNMNTNRRRQICRRTAFCPLVKIIRLFRQCSHGMAMYYSTCYYVVCQMRCIYNFFELLQWKYETIESALQENN